MSLRRIGRDCPRKRRGHGGLAEPGCAGTLRIGVAPEGPAPDSAGHPHALSREPALATGSLTCMRVQTAGGALLLGLAVAACQPTPHTSQRVPQGSPRPAKSRSAIRTALPSRWWLGPGGYPKGVINCSPPAAVWVHGRARLLGDCAGLLLVPAPTVTIRVGQLIGVHVAQAPSRQGSVPWFAPPTSSSPSLRQVALAGGGSTATYRAETAGRAVLRASRAQCVSPTREIRGCAVLKVVITR